VRQKTVSLEAAVAMCCEETSPVGVEKIKVESSVGRICGQDIFSPVDVPGFVRSRVDGYAVTRVDLEKSAKGEDLRLQVEDAIAAGNDRDIALTPGKCVKVMTGAALPQEAAAVVKQEDVQVDSERVIVGKGISHGENMETAGSIIAEGEKLLRTGRLEFILSTPGVNLSYRATCLKREKYISATAVFLSANCIVRGASL